MYRAHACISLRRRSKKSVRYIGGDHLVAHAMRQCGFSNFGREVGLLGAPDAEGRAETVAGQIAALHPAQHHQQRHVGEWLVAIATGEDVIARAGRFMPLSSANAASDNGTRCAFPPFIRSPGIVHTALVEIDLAPRRVERFSRACRGQNPSTQAHGPERCRSGADRS